MGQIARPCTNSQTTAFGPLPGELFPGGGQAPSQDGVFWLRPPKKKLRKPCVPSVNSGSMDRRGRDPRRGSFGPSRGTARQNGVGCHFRGSSPTMNWCEPRGNPSPKLRIPGNLADQTPHSSEWDDSVGWTPMQSRFSKFSASFLLENQEHSLARNGGRMLALLGEVAYCLDLSLSKSLLRPERRFTISGVSYQNAPRFAHKNFSLSQFSAKKTQVGEGKHLKTAGASEIL